MTDHEFHALQRLWSAVLLMVFTDFRKAVEKGKRRKNSGAAEAERLRARRYLASSDCRLLCDRAGVDINTEAAMRWIEGEGFIPKGRRASWITV